MNKYTSAQTANLLGVSRRTLERWRTSGKFVPEFKTLGGHSRYSEEQINQIQPFVSYFFELKKDVKALGYVNAKKLSFCHTPKLQYDFFYLKDLNWYKKPQNYIIDNFIKKEYDILINLCDSSCIPIKYLVASSRSS